MANLTKEQIQDVINQNEKFKNAYFWRPNQNASGRRNYETYNSRNIEGNHNGKILKLNLNISCSCKNIYVTRNFYINDKKVTIAAIKKLLLN